MRILERTKTERIQVRQTEAQAAQVARQKRAGMGPTKKHEEGVVVNTSELSKEEYELELSRVGAVYRLAFAREQHPELVRAEDRARVDLAAAIMGLDEVDDLIEQGEKIHNFQAQAAVEAASQMYQQALADLVRGESSAD